MQGQVTQGPYVNVQIGNSWVEQKLDPEKEEGRKDCLLCDGGREGVRRVAGESC